MDTNNLPLGELAQQRILDHVIAVGDEAETSYLEIKGSLDLTKGTSVAKVAKFLLGAANRLPQEAARYFHGYAVLVIGAQKGRAVGIPRGVEAHELEDRLRPYLGPQFPMFDLGRTSVDHDHEVLFIFAQPPQDGQTIFPCCKDFQGEDRQDNLSDGAIYVRGTSNTRPARSGDVSRLVERARGRKRPIELEVEVLGSVARVGRVTEVLEQLYKFEEEQFSATPDPVRNTSLLNITPPSIFGTPEPTSAEDRAARLESWRREKEANIARGREHFLGVALPGAGIRIISRDRFVAMPHLVVTFHGCEAFEFREPDDADFEKVVEPIVARPSRYVLGPDYTDYRITPRGYPVDWANQGGDVEVTLTPESFRPNTPWMSDQDDYVVIARDPEASTVSVSWVLTEDGNDTVTKGDLELRAGDMTDAADLFSAAFLDDAHDSQ
jgi:hypothetical protein